MHISEWILLRLRKLQARCLRNDFGKVQMRVPPEIAHWILNHKRDDLQGLESAWHRYMAALQTPLESAH